MDYSTYLKLKNYSMASRGFSFRPHPISVFFEFDAEPSAKPTSKTLFYLKYWTACLLSLNKLEEVDIRIDAYPTISTIFATDLEIVALNLSDVSMFPELKSVAITVFWTENETEEFPVQVEEDLLEADPFGIWDGFGTTHLASLTIRKSVHLSYSVKDNCGRLFQPFCQLVLRIGKPQTDNLRNRAASRVPDAESQDGGYSGANSCSNWALQKFQSGQPAPSPTSDLGSSRALIVYIEMSEERRHSDWVPEVMAPMAQLYKAVLLDLVLFRRIQGPLKE
ncbi:hypothetical protein GALMADRAFT_216773 [Galerina marginata CBS 339.88]|uniref:Uncharacterized protein n=1 Tax=Galerina marginata (strain CBS 339.88) TaxID=685588 RepID=A0A067S7Q9_GALM3|nr:hypothetical protein GALMADRAFT_216773 [Galerina marginata CBS 339.88]